MNARTSVIKVGQHWYSKDKTKIIVIRNWDEDVQLWRYWVEWQAIRYGDDRLYPSTPIDLFYTYNISEEKLLETYTVIPYYEMPEYQSSRLEGVS